MATLKELEEALSKIPIGIAPPPDHIYKINRNRMAPANDIWGTGTISYIPDHAEYIDGKGCFVFYKGLLDMPAPAFPSKTVAPPQDIHAVNSIKRIIATGLKVASKKSSLTPWGLLNNLCEALISVGEMTVLPYYLEDGYYCPLVKEIRKFVQTLLMELGVKEPIAIKTGEIIALPL